MCVGCLDNLHNKSLEETVSAVGLRIEGVGWAKVVGGR